MKSVRIFLLSVLLMACAADVRPTPSQIPAPSATLAATFTAQPSATPAPSPTLAPTATPIPQTTYTQLTQGECCVQPFFSPDGSQIMFLDKPTANAQTGIYAVPIDKPLSTPTLFNTHPGPYSRDMTLGADLERGATVIKRFSDGKRWVINNGGRSVTFSPDSKLIAYSIGEAVGNFDVRRSELHVANIDGSNDRVVATTYGGGFGGWSDDSKFLLVSGKRNRNDALGAFSWVSIEDQSVRQIAEVDRARNGSISPQNEWLIYFVSQSQEATRNGAWLLSLTDRNAQSRQLDVFGAFRWCSANTLIYLPVRIGAPSNELQALNVATGASKTLVAPSADSPFKISGGDWAMVRRADGSVDIAFVSVRDRNIWLAHVPNAC